MFWAIASSVFVIYLYRTLNAESTPAPEGGSADSIDAAFDALNARITALEGKIAGTSSGDARP